MVAREELILNVLRELELSADERLIRLGRQSLPHGLGSEAGDYDDEHYKRVGASLLSRIMHRARQGICESAEIRATVKTLRGDTVALVAPIADVVATFVSGPAIFTATASIVAVGLQVYCESYWKDSTEKE